MEWTFNLNNEFWRSHRMFEPQTPLERSLTHHPRELGTGTGADIALKRLPTLPSFPQYFSRSLP
jgi:hypothetical protein